MLNMSLVKHSVTGGLLLKEGKKRGARRGRGGDGGKGKEREGEGR